MARQLWPQVPPARATDVKGCLAKNLHQNGKGELEEMGMAEELRAQLF